MKADELRERLEGLKDTLDSLQCPEGRLALLKARLDQVYVIVFPPDGSPGLVAQVITMNHRLDNLETANTDRLEALEAAQAEQKKAKEKAKEDKEKSDQDFKRAVVIAVIAALASVSAALVAVFGG